MKTYYLMIKAGYNNPVKIYWNRITQQWVRSSYSASPYFPDEIMDENGEFKPLPYGIQVVEAVK